jgi:hypothetical protein
MSGMLKALGACFRALVPAPPASTEQPAPPAPPVPPKMKRVTVMKMAVNQPVGACLTITGASGLDTGWVNMPRDATTICIDVEIPDVDVKITAP